MGTIVFSDQGPDPDDPFSNPAIEFDKLETSAIAPESLEIEQGSWNQNLRLLSIAYVSAGNFGRVYKCKAIDLDNPTAPPVELLLALKIDKSASLDVVSQELISMAKLDGITGVPKLYADPEYATEPSAVLARRLPMVRIIFELNGEKRRAEGVGIVMQFIEGENMAKLANEMRQNNVGMTEYIDNFASQLALIIHLTQRAGIVHHDLKPINMIGAGDPAKPDLYALDWGISANLENGKMTAAYGLRTEQALGTPNYMCPAFYWTKDKPEREDFEFNCGLENWTALNIMFQQVFGYYPIMPESTPVTAATMENRLTSMKLQTILVQDWATVGPAAAMVMPFPAFCQSLEKVLRLSKLHPDADIQKHEKQLVIVFAILQVAMNRIIDPQYTVQYAQAELLQASGIANQPQELGELYNSVLRDIEGIKFTDVMDVVEVLNRTLNNKLA